jgi:hypothetical protein
MKYRSITTPDISHDEANILAEMTWLNRDLGTDMFPWRGENGKEWGRLVAAFKRLMGPSFGLSAEQLAFYVFKCRPHQINPPEFAKMAVVARKLFRRYNIEEVCTLYTDKRREFTKPGLEKASYKQEKPKTLLSFLRELERGEVKD